MNKQLTMHGSMTEQKGGGVGRGLMGGQYHGMLTSIASMGNLINIITDAYLF